MASSSEARESARGDDAEARPAPLKSGANDDSDAEDGSSASSVAASTGRGTASKRKYAVLLAFCGAGYQGYQL